MVGMDMRQPQAVQVMKRHADFGQLRQRAGPGVQQDVLPRGFKMNGGVTALRRWMRGAAAQEPHTDHSVMTDALKSAGTV